MTDDSQFSRTLLLAVDAWRYGTRDDRQQHDLQRALADVLRDAAVRGGLDPARWRRQEAGDGVFALITDESAEPKVIGPFVRELDEWLRRHNHDLRPQARLRLRVAVHHGVTLPGELGYAGAAPVHVCRLRDARAVREALEAFPEANLVLAVSEPIFDGSVRQRHTSLTAEDFTRVEVAEPAKQFFATAWVHVPGIDAGRVGACLGTLAVGLRFAGTAAPPPGFFGQVVRPSFEAVGVPAPESVEGDLAFRVPAALAGTALTGTWIEEVRKAATAHFPHVRVAVGIALAADPAVARAEAAELAGAEPAGRLLAATGQGRLVVVVSERVHQVVVARGGRLVFPESYRRPDGETGCWLRVPGHSVPPEPAPAPEPPGSAAPSAAQPVSATTHGDHSTAIGHGTFTAPITIGGVHRYGNPR
ncbi:hypothetical protein AB0M80_28325 [Amycolatopsis sp. NPDC051045]|uniref:hypothetical protein n=1 Tax=Amycolatopsis sp. NPDC051045 TaxID=3156922 RepID=UPI00343ADA01